MTESEDPISELNPDGHAVMGYIRGELDETRATRRQRALAQIVLAGLSGVPWVGGLISAGIAIRSAGDQAKVNDLQQLWLEKHDQKFERLQGTASNILRRIDALGPDIDDRLESPEFLTIVEKAFRVLDEADTEEKRQFVGTLIGNAAGTNIVNDDVVRLFLEWLSRYHESHFAVVREIFQKSGSTRLAIWSRIYGRPVPRQDSAEADLFRLLFRDLSTGGLIRQRRGITAAGDFQRSTPARRPRGTPAPTTIATSFDDEDEYVLTALGEQFVHYTMKEVVRRLDAPNGT